MSKIKLDPAELKIQADEMLTLSSKYESLFSDVNSTLNKLNNNWSANLANNFSSKVSNAQKSFSNIVEMLKIGGNAANSSAESFISIDAQLAKGMDGRAFGGGAGGGGFRGDRADTVSDKIKEVGKNIQNSIKDIIAPTKNQIEMLLENINLHNEDTTIDISGDTKKDIENFYRDKIVSSNQTNNTINDIYTTTGSTSGRKKIVGDVYYEITNDIKTYYGDLNESHASGGMTITGQRIVIGEDLTQPINIKLNTIDYHAIAEFSPKNGDVYASAGVGWDVVSVGLEAGDIEEDLLALGVDLKIGLGASFDVGIRDGIIKMDAGIAAGPGVDFNIEFNYKDAWNTFCDVLNIN